MNLTPPEREVVEQWVEAKFQTIPAEQLEQQVPAYNWERIDPWLAQMIEDEADFDRYPGHGSMEGQMVVRVVMHDALADPMAEPLSSLWSFADLKRNNCNPLDDADVALFTSLHWETVFGVDLDAGAVEALGDDVWVPRSNARANDPGASPFARIAGAAGFYVFDVSDHVVLGIDYSTADPITMCWAGLYTALTGQAIGRPHWER